MPDKVDNKESLYDKLFVNFNPISVSIEIAIFLLILLSIVIIILREYFSFTNVVFLHLIDWGITLLLTIEYFARVFLNPKPFKFIFSFKGIIIFISIVPQYIIYILGANSLLELVRLLRLLTISSRLVNILQNLEDLLHFNHDVKEHLSSNEKILYSFHMSRRRFFFKYLFYILILILSIFSLLSINSLNTNLDYFILSTGYLFFLVSLILIFRLEVKNWMVRYYITPQRLIISKGILSKHFNSLTFSYIAENTYFQNLYQRFFFIGTIHITTTGNDDKNVDLMDISKPGKINSLIHNLIVATQRK